jgi:hypothetical protein
MLEKFKTINQSSLEVDSLLYLHIIFGNIFRHNITRLPIFSENFVFIMTKSLLPKATNFKSNTDVPKIAD